MGVEGDQHWGSGTAPLDVNLTRSAPGLLSSNGKDRRRGRPRRGQQRRRERARDDVRKMEVFDASGNSLGFVAIHANAGGSSV